MAEILRIGVTGGIGSGKSVVCSIFSRLGFPVLFADDIAKAQMVLDPLRGKLRDLLGESAFRPDGEVDRAYVASRIFSNRSLQKAVNSLVHPSVEAELDKEFQRLRSSGAKAGIVEAALLYESGYYKFLDVMIVVDAPEADRIKRVAGRDGTREADIRKRMRAQWHVEEKLKKADFIIRNAGSPEELENSVRFLATILTSLAEDHE